VLHELLLLLLHTLRPNASTKATAGAAQPGNARHSSWCPLLLLLLLLLSPPLL
jgi:hypothetical protein